MVDRRGASLVLATALLVLVVVPGCTRIPPVESPEAGSLLGLPVESWQEVDCGPLNALADEAGAVGLKWTESPAQVLLESLGGDLELVALELVSTGNRAEFPDTVFAEIARDGFMDDALRGDRHEAVLARVDDGTWRFHTLRRAFRCWRVRHLDSYSAEFCP